MNLYRNLAFVAYGTLNFTNGAFERISKRSFNPSALEVNTRDKIIIVTGFLHSRSTIPYLISGANAGLGRETAYQLAKRGATVHMLCRSRERGEEARDWIKAQTKNDRVFLHVADISKPSEVFNFAREFGKVSDRLDVLINNAGILPAVRELTPNGIESTFATNSLGSFTLIKFLMPLLEKTVAKTTNVRVINVSSGGAYTSRLDLGNLENGKNGEKFDGSLAYAHTKRQQIVMTQELALAHPSIGFYSCHPGWAETPGVKSSIPDFYATYQKYLRTPEQGADTIIWLAISKEIEGKPSGEFWFDRHVAPKHLFFACTQESKDEAKKFMDILEDYVKKCLQQ